MCMLVPLCSGIVFSAKQDSEFMNIMIHVNVSLGIWTLACARPTLDLKNPKCIGTIWTNFPKPIQVLLSL